MPPIKGIVCSIEIPAILREDGAFYLILMEGKDYLIFGNATKFTVKDGKLDACNATYGELLKWLVFIPTAPIQVTIWKDDSDPKRISKVEFVR